MGTSLDIRNLTVENLEEIRKQNELKNLKNVVEVEISKVYTKGEI